MGVGPRPTRPSAAPSHLCASRNLRVDGESGVSCELPVPTRRGLGEYLGGREPSIIAEGLGPAQIGCGEMNDGLRPVFHRATVRLGLGYLDRLTREYCGDGFVEVTHEFAALGRFTFAVW